MNKKEELIYMAGLMDAQGTWSIQVGIRKGTRDSIHFNPRMSISFKHGSNILQIFKDQFGGKIYNSSTSDMKRWSTGRKEIMVNATRKLLPYLSVKKNIAERFLEAMDIFPDLRANHASGERSWTEEMTQSVAQIALTLNPESSRKSKKTLSYLNQLNKMYKLDATII